MRYPFAEFSANFAKPRQAALIFHRIMEQRRDGHFFVAAIFNYQGSDTQQVADIRPLGAFADLPPMQARRIAESLRELVRKNWLCTLDDGSCSLALPHFA
jgi:hypothetical protein